MLYNTTDSAFKNTIYMYIVSSKDHKFCEHEDQHENIINDNQCYSGCCHTSISCCFTADCTMSTYLLATESSF